MVATLAVLGAGALLPHAAGAAATGWVGDVHARARLVTATVATGSAPQLDAGLEIRMAKGWHAYWRTPGAAGTPPTIDWKGSENLKSAAIAWPAPTRLVIDGLQSYVYPDHVLLPITVTLAHPGRPATLHATVDYAACAQICVPYHVDLILTVPAGLALPDRQARLIAAAQALVPGSLEAARLSLVSATVAPAGRDGAALTVRLRSIGAPFRTPDLFVEGLRTGDPGHPRLSLSPAGRTASITVPVQGTAASALIKPLTFTVTDGPLRAAEFVATPVPGAAPPIGGTALLPVLGIALLGGLILNLMPCVLPVLSLKLLGLARLAGAERRTARLSLFATAAGVLASFVLLAGVLIALKAVGAAIGWGIQFQQPWFLAGMATVTVLFAASLWGWLGIGLPSAVQGATALQLRRPLANAFLTGAFATLLATSCSAPFVGTAVGFALSRGPGEIAGIFACLGLGLAAPYLAVAVVPGLVRLLPRPGRWMIWLQRVLGLALLGTAAWLLSVLALVAGLVPAIVTGAALLLLLAGLWWRARRGLRARPRRAMIAGLALASVAVLVPQFATAPDAVATAPSRLWQPFDLGRIHAAVAQGKTVFVDVTAAWCLICKANEVAVLDRAPVAGRLAAPGILAMRADWTRPDPAITAYLKSFGRYGVPLDVVYGPASSNGEALPDLLTTGAVLGALDRARGDTASVGDPAAVR